jgi:signal transduction histidine kinase/ActR/RegA family two-component response regulator
MTFAAALAIFSSALSAYVAALNHRFAQAPGWRDQRWFSVVALAIACYSALNLPVTLSDSDATVLAASRAQLFLIGVHAAAWILYSRAQLASPPRCCERLLAGGLVALGAVSLVPGAAYTSPVRRSFYEPLQATYAVPATTLLGDLLFVLALLALAIVTVRYAIAALRGGGFALTHFLSLAVFLVLEANDVLVALGAYTGPFLVDVAVLLPVAAVGYSLTSRFAADARALADLRGRLEALVEERTRELSQAQEALHRAEKLAALGQLSAGVAHEVNNPVAVVSANLGYLEEGLEEGELPPDALPCIRESLTATRRIAAIVRQLLDAGRVAATHVPLEPVSLARCAREATTVARARVAEGVSVGLAIDEDLHVIGHDRVLVQILVNLLVNGAQAVPAGRRGRVAVTAERVAGGRVHVHVEDDGVGMDAEVLRRAFEPFFSTKPLGVGTGLGLAVSRGLTASLGGRLDIVSAPGRGTRVTLDLAAASGREARIEEGAPQRQAGQRLRVLVVDDEPDVLRALTRALERNYAVSAAGSVDEALALADLRSPDLVLCDVTMPNGGGEAVYQGLRQHFPELSRRLVFLTGGAPTETARAFLAARPQPVLEKPLDLATLAKVAERLVPGRCTVT